MKRYNTPHRHRVIKTRLTEEEYAEFSERVTLCKMSQAEFIRQALIKSSIRPVITVSPVKRVLITRRRCGVLYFFMAVNLLSWVDFFKRRKPQKAGLGWQPQQDSRRTKLSD